MTKEETSRRYRIPFHILDEYVRKAVFPVTGHGDAADAGRLRHD